MKFKVKQKGAIRTSIGFLNVLDLTYLHDYNPAITQSLSIGATGVAIGLIFHQKLSDKHIGHLSINYNQNWEILASEHNCFPSLFLGFGIE